MGNAGRVLMIPKGDYNAATTYEMLDFVYYQGRSYVCKQTSTGNVPTNTTYWQALTGDASAEIQALTNYVAENNVKNLFNIYGEKASQNVTSATIESNGFRLVQSTAETFKNLQMWLRGLKKNTDYVFYTNCTITSGHPLVLIDNSSGTTVGRLNPPTAGANVLNFNTGNDTDFKFYFYCVTGTSETGEVLYADIMVCEKAVYDADPTYQPYAKTNVELTADVNDLNKVTTGTITLSSDYFDTADTSNNYGTWERNGKVVTFFMQGITKAEIPSGNINLAQGLPLRIGAPIVGFAYDITNGAANPSLLGQVRITAGASSIINYPFNNAIATGKKIRIFGTYICD